jgi:hypothetical protein
MVIIERKRNATVWGDPQLDGSILYAVTTDKESNPIEPKTCIHATKFKAWASERSEPKDAK